MAEDWPDLTREAMAILQREVELLEIVQLVGPDALSETEQAVLDVARMLREDFLMQSAYHDIDRYCPVDKTYWMLTAIIDFYHHTQRALENGIDLKRITDLPVVAEIARMKEIPVDKAVKAIQELIKSVKLNFTELGLD